MKPSILLVDDDPADLAALRMLLEKWGYAVTAVRSGAEAMARLDQEAVDLVLTDIRMPAMSGDDLARQARERHPGLPVMLIAAQGDVRSAVYAMRSGACDYVLKPADPDDLRLSVQRAIEHSRLRRENACLRAELGAGGAYGERLIGRSPKMLEVIGLINRAARTDGAVLITGETGTGKDRVAQVIHYRGARAGRPFVALNCAAPNPDLIESELFGNERGAFTGASSARRGRFEEADGGTLFLDEIGETAPEFQSRLLRVLQEGEFERVGDNRRIRVDVRLLSSTSRDLRQAVADGRFREDLYHRLSAIPIAVPPLRERRDDIEPLAAHFVALYARRYHCPARGISAEALACLQSLPWPGNVRELQHAVERAVVLSPHEVLDAAAFAAPGGGAAAEAPEGRESLSLETFVERQTRRHVLRVLDAVKWRKSRAAAILGVDRATLYRMLKRYSLPEARRGPGRRE